MAKGQTKVEVLTDFTVPYNAEVKFTTMGNVAGVKYMQRRNRKATIKKLSKDSIVVVGTGEVKKVNDSNTNRMQNLEGVRRSMIKGREFITTNVTDISKCRWVTLTFAKNLTDEKELYREFYNFIGRFDYWLKKNELPSCKYIVAMEPQARGAWHAHVIFIFDGKAPYIPNQIGCKYNKNMSWEKNFKRMMKHEDTNAPLLQVWKQGWVTVKSLKDIDNVGAYLTSYLSDVELNDAVKEGLDITDREIVEKEIEENGKKVKKKFVKGARLDMYPKNFNIFRHSQNMKEPVHEYMTKYEALKKVGFGEPTFEKTVKLKSYDQEGNIEFENIINNTYYNVARSNSQGLIDKNSLRQQDFTKRSKVKKTNNSVTNTVEERQVKYIDLVKKAMETACKKRLQELANRVIKPNYDHLTKIDPNSVAEIKYNNIPATNDNMVFLFKNNSLMPVITEPKNKRKVPQITYRTKMAYA